MTGIEGRAGLPGPHGVRGLPGAIGDRGKPGIQVGFSLLCISLLLLFFFFFFSLNFPVCFFLREKGVCQVTGAQQELRACRAPPEIRAERAILGSKVNQ